MLNYLSDGNTFNSWNICRAGSLVVGGGGGGLTLELPQTCVSENVDF